MPTDVLNLIGAGGHATVVVDALLRLGYSSAMFAIWSEDKAQVGETVLGTAVRHLRVEQLAGESFHVCIGDNAVRERLYTELVAAGARPRSVVHPSAVIAHGAILGAGSFVAAGAILGPKSATGAACIVNHGAIADHDVVVADFSHVAPGATLAGRVRIGAAVLVGAGANILPGIAIGDHATVGAGAVVVADVPSASVVAGVPARQIY